MAHAKYLIFIFAATILLINVHTADSAAVETGAGGPKLTVSSQELIQTAKEQINLICSAPSEINSCAFEFNFKNGTPRHTFEVYDAGPDNEEGRTFHYDGRGFKSGECGIVVQAGLDLEGSVTCRVTFPGASYESYATVAVVLNVPPSGAELACDGIQDDCLYEEGEMMNITCSALEGSVSSATRISIFLDDQIMVTGSNISILFYNKVAEFSDKDKKIKCLVTNAKLKSPLEQTRSLVVEFEPTIKNQDTDIETCNITVGEDCFIKVKILANPRPSFEWTRLGMTLDLSRHQPWKNIEIEDKYWVTGLNVSGVTNEDMAAEYNLKASNERGSNTFNISFSKILASKFLLQPDGPPKNEENSVALAVVLGVALLLLFITGAVLFAFKKQILKLVDKRRKQSWELRPDNFVVDPANEYMLPPADDIKGITLIEQNLSLQSHYLHGGDFYIEQKIYSENQKLESIEDLAKAVASMANRPILISAAAGMGKSRALAEMGRRVSELQQNFCVVHLRLSEFCRQLEGDQITMTRVADYAKTKFALDDDMSTILNGKLDTKQVLILVDEFNKIGLASKDNADKLLQLLRREGLKVVAAVRPEEEHRVAQALLLDDRANIFRLRPLDEWQRIQFLAKYWHLKNPKRKSFKSFEDEAKTALKNWGADDAVGTPLCLLLAAEAKTEEKNLDMEFVHKFIYKLLRSNIRKLNDIGCDLESKAIDFLHKFSIATLLEDSEDCIEVIKSDNNIKDAVVHLIKVENDKVSFLHTAFAEYLLCESLLTEKSRQDSFPPGSLQKILEEDKFKLVRSVINNSTRVKNFNPEFEDFSEHHGKVIRVLLTEKLFNIYKIIYTEQDLNKVYELEGEQQHPLIWAIKKASPNSNQDFDTINFLVENGANLQSIVDAVGNTALHYAALAANESLVQALLNFEAALNLIHAKNAVGSTPIICAAEAGHLGVFRLLVEAGASMEDVREADGKNCLHLAAGGGHVELTRHLLEETNLEVDCRSAMAGLTPLLCAVLKGHSEAAKLLLTRDADPTVQDERGNSALHLAAIFGHLATLRTLVDVGPDVDLRNKEGETPLHYAVAGGSAEVVDFLIDKAGAAVDAVDHNGSTCLHVAVANGQVALVRYFAQKLGVGRRNNNGATALQLAIEMNNGEVVQALLESGSKDSDGTGLELARTRGQAGIEKMLSERSLVP